MQKTSGRLIDRTQSLDSDRLKIVVSPQSCILLIIIIIIIIIIVVVVVAAAAVVLNDDDTQEVYRGVDGACSVEGLHFDAEYRARVNALNRVGCSAYSGLVRIHTAPGIAFNTVIFLASSITIQF